MYSQKHDLSSGLSPRPFWQGIHRHWRDLWSVCSPISNLTSDLLTFIQRLSHSRSFGSTRGSCLPLHSFCFQRIASNSRYQGTLSKIEYLPARNGSQQSLFRYFSRQNFPNQGKCPTCPHKQRWSNGHSIRNDKRWVRRPMADQLPCSLDLHFLSTSCHAQHFEISPTRQRPPCECSFNWTYVRTE